MSTASDMVSQIETTLAELYALKHKQMSQKDRTAVMQDIAALEKSRDYWQRQVVSANGTRPRVSNIDLSGF